MNDRIIHRRHGTTAPRAKSGREITPAAPSFRSTGLRLGDVADREDDVLDRCPAGIEAGANVLADLFDLRPEIALADEISGLVAGDLPADDDPVPAVA